jgi:hypothetical protein
VPAGNRDGSVRDEATIQQLIVLSNLESMNAELIKQGVPQNQRLVALNKMAIEQMTSILGSAAIKHLDGPVGVNAVASPPGLTGGGAPP